MRWDAGTYLKFADARTRAAADLLARVPIDEPRLVVDLGCGPGNSTRLLRERWPGARIVGVDRSPEMLAAARREGPEAEWVEGTIETWEPDAPPDVIFSNAALHWVRDHAALVPRLVEALAPGGVLAVQVPHRVPGQAFVEALIETARGGPWPEHFAELPWGTPGPRAEDYYGWLAGRASAIDVWTTEYLHALEGEDAVLEWTRGTALLPFLERLPDPDRAAFVEGYRQRLRHAYPRRPDGVTLFPMPRLFFVAVR